MLQHRTSGAARPLLISLLLGAALAVSPLALAQQGDSGVDTTWTNGEGQPWKNADGDCWRDPSQPDGAPVEECGDTVAEAEDEPEPAPEPETRTETRTETDRLDADTLFEFGDATLTDTAEDSIDSLMDRRTGEWDVQAITIIGYTDRIGSEDNNLELSRERARSVADYLQQRADLAGVDVSVEGRGEADPRVTCEDAEGRDELIDCLAPNRRVELEMELQRETQVSADQ